MDILADLSVFVQSVGREMLFPASAFLSVASISTVAIPIGIKDGAAATVPRPSGSGRVPATRRYLEILKNIRS